MALLFADSFDLYATGSAGRTDIQEAGWGWGGFSISYLNPSTTGGRFGGGALQSTHYSSYIYRSVNIAASTIIVQAAFKFTSMSTGTNRNWVRFYNNSGADRVCALLVQVDGSIKILDSTDTVVATSSSGVLKQSVWQYLEIKVVSNNGAGSVAVRINEASAVTIGSIDTSVSATDIDVVRFYPGGTGNNCWWDDVLILDDSGAAPQNDFIGDVKISTLLPEADTATTDWDRNTGANDFEMIDDVVPGDHDGDTTYIYDDTVGGKSLFDCAAMATTPAYIYGVGVAVAAKKSDAGGKTMRAYIDSGGTVGNGDTWSIGTDYQTWRYIWSLNPNGSAVWLKAAVDALQLGVEVVS